MSVKTVLFRIISIVRVLPLRHNVVTRQSHDDELQCSLLSGKLDQSSVLVTEIDHWWPFLFLPRRELEEENASWVAVRIKTWIQPYLFDTCLPSGLTDMQKSLENNSCQSTYDKNKQNKNSTITLSTVITSLPSLWEYLNQTTLLQGMFFEKQIFCLWVYRFYQAEWLTVCWACFFHMWLIRQHVIAWYDINCVWKYINEQKCIINSQ